MPTIQPPPFTHLGRYRVLRELGRGAMGVVWLAEDEPLQRQVAIKTLLLPDDEQERAHLEARFRQEAKAAGGLNHPGIITIHDLGREGDWLYIAMELLQGTVLRDRMAQGMLPLDEALDIAGQVAAALAAAHARGIVHRDIKPGNIMVGPGGHAKIMDFGIARMQQSELRTRSGTMMGSPSYMSPEQVTGHAADHRSDIFSLGSMLYELVTGEPPFAGNNLGELLNAILHGAPRPPGQVHPGVPATVELVIARAMQKNAAARYQDAGEMAADLAQCRAALARGRPHARTTVADAADPYATTIVAEAAPAVAAPPSWLPSRQFDSSAGLRRLMQDSGPPPAATRRAPPVNLLRIAWVLAYVLAAAAGIAIALT